MINWNRSLKLWGIVILATSPALIGFAPRPSLDTSSFKSTEISLKFPNTGNRGAPKITSGGGTRSDDTSCISTQEGILPLVALMPNRENKAKTASKTPNLYVYIPQTTATEGEVVIVDENEQEVYFSQFTLPTQPGMVKVTLPVAFEAGKSYNWSFMVICDSRYRNRDKFVEGVIEFVDLDSKVENQLKTASPLEKAQLYADSTLWFEAFDIVAQTRAENPTTWQELLNSVGLDMLVDAPILNCCQAKQ